VLIFGGPTWPIGWGVGYLKRPYEDVRLAFGDWYDELRFESRWIDLDDMSLLDMLRRLAPIQGTYTRHLIVQTVGPWTACFDNSQLGGDQASWVGYLSRRLDCEAILATHVPREQYGLPATQFQLLGPSGDQPLRYVRTISAGIFDEGRWRFDVSGAPQPFEDVAAYSRRLIRDRFTREMLLNYLRSHGISADDPSFYRNGSIIEDVRPWTNEGSSIEGAQRRYAR